jgi:fumarate reductase subunit D
MVLALETLQIRESSLLVVEALRSHVQATVVVLLSMLMSLLWCKDCEAEHGYGDCRIEVVQVTFCAALHTQVQLTTASDVTFCYYRRAEGRKGA